jgi:hypothetical protein
MSRQLKVVLDQVLGHAVQRNVALLSAFSQDSQMLNPATLMTEISHGQFAQFVAGHDRAVWPEFAIRRYHRWGQPNFPLIRMARRLKGKLDQATKFTFGTLESGLNNNSVVV